MPTRGPTPHARAVAYAPDLESIDFLLSRCLRGAPPPMRVPSLTLRILSRSTFCSVDAYTGPHPHARAVAYAPDLESIDFLLSRRLCGAPPPCAAYDFPYRHDLGPTVLTPHPLPLSPISVRGIRVVSIIMRHKL